MAATATFAILAGLLSTLSPCVLPLIPIVLGAAAGEHPRGPLALAGGLALSFTVIGIFVATIGFAIGLDAGLFRIAGGMVLLMLGAVLLLPRLQAQVALAAGPLSNRGEQWLGGFNAAGLHGQFGVGLLLGVVWSPCVGPTLGAASMMAARGENLGEVALTMLAFGVGAAVPLLLLGLLSREAFVRWRGRMLASGTGARRSMGGVLSAMGLLIITGADKRVESWLLDVSPLWLTGLSTRF